MMKKIGLFFLVLMTQLMVKAQSKSEKEVLFAVEELRAAMVSGNREALERIADVDLSYGHSAGKIEDKAAFVEAIASGKSDFVSIELTNQTVKVTGKIALVRHQLHAATNDGGKPAEVHLGVLLVWKKQAGSWRLLGRQAFKLAN